MPERTGLREQGNQTRHSGALNAGVQRWEVERALDRRQNLQRTPKKRCYDAVVRETLQNHGGLRVVGGGHVEFQRVSLHALNEHVVLADVRLQQAFGAVASELARRDGEVERGLGDRNEHFGRVGAACLGLRGRIGRT